MSGHSKWHNIQKTKGAADAKRSAAFTKIAKEIIVAVKQGGSGDPANNSRLATVIAKAKANNMPNDNIKRTIDKALGSGNTDNYESVTYEGYGPGGVAVIVEALTDNRQRTAPEVRHYFDKFGKGMGAQGCVSWSFDRKGVIIIDNEDGDYDEDTVMMDALEAGAADFTADGPVFEITTDPDAFNDVIAALEAKGYTFASADISLIPQTYVKLTSVRTSRTWKSCLICSRTTRTCRTPTTTGRPRTKPYIARVSAVLKPLSCDIQGSICDMHNNLCRDIQRGLFFSFLRRTAHRAGSAITLTIAITFTLTIPVTITITAILFMLSKHRVLCKFRKF